MSETVAKTTIEVKADTSQAQKAIRDLAQETAKGNTELKRQAEQASLVGKKFEELGKSMVGLQINETFKRLSTSVKEATGDVLDLNGAFAGWQAAGPWGAAIGLVGAAVAKTANLLDGMGVSLDELEKKAQAHARTFMPGLTGEIWKQHDAIREMNLRLAETPGALARAFTELAKIYPILKRSREEIQAYDSLPARINRGLGAASTGLGDVIGSATTRGLGASSWGGVKFKQGRGGPSYDRAATDLGSQIAGNIGSYDYLQSMQDRADAQSRLNTSNMIRSSADLGGYGGFQSQLDAFNQGEGARRTAEAYGDYAMGKQSSWMEKTFGPVGQFDAYASAFQGFTGAVTSSYEAIVTGSESAGKAFKKAIASAVMATGAQALVEGLKESAWALGSLAIGNMGAAATHGLAAAKWGAVAVAAGLAARSLGAGGGASSAPSSGSAPNVSGSGGGGPAGRNITIVYGDSYAEDNPRSRQLRAERDIERAMGTQAVEYR